MSTMVAESKVVETKVAETKVAEKKPAPAKEHFWTFEDSISRLITELSNEDAGPRLRACWALSQIGPAAVGAVPALLAALKDPHANVREAAATALGKIHAEPKQCVASLIEMLKDKDWRVRGRAAEVLGDWGRVVAHDALPSLKSIAADSDPSVRAAVAGALRRLNGVEHK